VQEKLMLQKFHAGLLPLSLHSLLRDRRAGMWDVVQCANEVTTQSSSMQAFCH
jgi:hypothetical protein